jgi:hypothetical protein
MILWSESWPAAKIAPKTRANTAPTPNAFSVFSNASTRVIWMFLYSSQDHFRPSNWPLSANR